MENSLERSWWSMLFMGLIALTFGIVVFAWPDITLWSLIVLFSIFVLVYGLLALVTSIENRTIFRRWWLLFLTGIASIAVGIISLVWPDLTALALLYIIGAWCIATGVFKIGAAIRLQTSGDWLLVLSGLAGVVFGIMLLVWPVAGALAILWLIATVAVVVGVFMIMESFAVMVRHHRHARSQLVI